MAFLLLSILRIIFLTVHLWCHARNLLEHGNKHALRGETQRGRDHKIGQVVLEIADENYENDYLLYKMKIDTNLTNEVGQVQFRVHFIQVEMNEEGKVTTTVRQTDSFIMTVIPISDWFSAPDELLSALDQRLIANQQTIKALADLQNTLSDEKLDDIKLDITSNEIYGTSNGEKKGEGIKLSDLGDAIADNTEDGMVVINTYDDEEDGS